MMRTFEKVRVKGRKVLVRADFNVPLDENRNITDDMRIRAVLPTIEWLLERDAKIILMSHLGRPEGKVDPRYSLNMVQDRLFEYLDVSIGKAPDCVGREVTEIVGEMMPGEIVLLENLRFHPEEEANDGEFARALAALGDFYVNDAFGASHRAHASIVGIPQLLPSYAGMLLEKEVRVFGDILERPRQPLVLLMGGAKASEKVAMLQALEQRASHICVGGVLANTILQAKGIATGRSKVAEEAKDLLKSLVITSTRIHLPVDVVVADDIVHPSRTSVKAVGQVARDEYILDIGPETIQLFTTIIGEAGTVFWNGPMGLFEKQEFARGTETIARAIAASRGVKVVGGGEAAAALEQFGLTDSVDHISTGGGAMLEFLAGKRLPGLEALGYYN